MWRPLALATQLAAPGSFVALSVVASGSAPLSYQWQFQGTNLPKSIVTLAGNANQGYSGDGSQATNAKLNNPFGIAVRDHHSLTR